MVVYSVSPGKVYRSGDGFRYSYKIATALGTKKYNSIFSFNTEDRAEEAMRWLVTDLRKSFGVPKPFMVG